MIDLPFFPSLSAYCNIAPFKWRASRADSPALSYPHSLSPSDKMKKEHRAVLGEEGEERLMPRRCPVVAEAQCVHWFRVSIANCTLS